MSPVTPRARLLSQLVATLGLSVLASGCVEDPAQECCTYGMRRVCLCADGFESYQSCSEDGWGSCECGCVPWETRTCRCEDGESGMQVCGQDRSWMPCQCESARWPDTHGECSPGETFCEGTGCISTAHSENNCGACGSVCQGCDRCIRGECTPTCCDGETNCGTVQSPLCAALSFDVDNCGACGNACGDDERCDAGRCGP